MNSQPFDNVAKQYDASFTDTATARVLRNIVWERMTRHFRAPMRVLELGCGTGEDAVHLAKRGVRIVALDPAAGMIAAAQAKARLHRCSELIEFRCLAMEDAACQLEGQRFDGVYSNFGAVNCVAELQSLVRGIASLLAPNAPLLWVVMGRHVPWEWLWYLLRGQWAQATRRLRSSGADWRGMKISYPTPDELAAMLAPHFIACQVAPLGVALPPTYAAAWLNRSPRLLRALTGLERLAQRSSALASCSDHYVLEAMRGAGTTGQRHP